MLNINQILSYTNSKIITKNILTEYYQHEILGSIFSQKNSEHLSFIGGTAIRICYSGQRFSEDLDFDTDNLDIFDQLLQDTLSDLVKKGFIVESRIVHKGAYHCYIKFPHILKNLNLSGYQEEKLLIKVDAAPITPVMSQAIILNNYGIFQNIRVSPPDVLLSKKLLTVMARKRTKGRDLYDITYLWGLSEPNQKYLETVGKTNLNTLLSQLIIFSRSLNLSQVAQEVSPFLTNAQDSNRVIHFADFIQSKLQPTSPAES